MKTADFTKLVQQMRAAQRKYFRTRDRGVLADAQRLEREVDDAIRAAEATESLFDESAAAAGEPE